MFNKVYGSMGRQAWKAFSNQASRFGTSATESAAESTPKVVYLTKKTAAFHLAMLVGGAAAFNKDCRDAFRDITASASKAGGALAQDLTQSVEDFTKMAKNFTETVEEENLDVITTAEETNDAFKLHSMSLGRGDEETVRGILKGLILPMKEKSEALREKIEEIDALYEDPAADTKLDKAMEEAIAIRSDLSRTYKKVFDIIHNENVSLTSKQLVEEREDCGEVSKLLSDTDSDVASYKERLAVKRALLGLEKASNEVRTEINTWKQIKKEKGEDSSELAAQTKVLRGSVELLEQERNKVGEQLKGKSVAEGSMSKASRGVTEIVTEVKTMLGSHEDKLMVGTAFHKLETASKGARDELAKWEEMRGGSDTSGLEAQTKLLKAKLESLEKEYVDVNEIARKKGVMAEGSVKEQRSLLLTDTPEFVFKKREMLLKHERKVADEGLLNSVKGRVAHLVKTEEEWFKIVTDPSMSDKEKIEKSKELGSAADETVKAAEVAEKSLTHCDAATERELKGAKDFGNETKAHSRIMTSEKEVKAVEASSAKKPEAETLWETTVKVAKTAATWTALLAVGVVAGRYSNS